MCRAFGLPKSKSCERSGDAEVFGLLTYHGIFDKLNWDIQDLEPQITADACKRLVAKPRQPIRDVPN